MARSPFPGAIKARDVNQGQPQRSTIAPPRCFSLKRRDARNPANCILRATLDLNLIQTSRASGQKPELETRCAYRITRVGRVSHLDQRVLDWGMA
jgi:hypothetical protein